jgi:hypothetical protein
MEDKESLSLTKSYRFVSRVSSLKATNVSGITSVPIIIIIVISLSGKKATAGLFRSHSSLCLFSGLP